jgi:tryptophan synthase beta subunit
LKHTLPALVDGTVVLVNLSGRGDKDVETVRGLLAARGGRA